MITKTFGGVGADFATPHDAYIWLATQMPFADNYDMVCNGDCAVGGNMAWGFGTEINTNGYEITFRGDTPHDGDPTAGRTISVAADGAYTNVFCPRVIGGVSGKFIVKDLKFQTTGLNAGFNNYILYNTTSGLTGTQIIYDSIIILGNNQELAGIGIYGGWDFGNIIIKACKLYNCNIGIKYGGSVGTQAGILKNTIEHCTIDGGSTGILFSDTNNNGFIIRNTVCFGQATTSWSTPVTPVYSSIANSADDDGSLPAWATASQENITPADEFQSQTSTDPTFLFLKNNAVGVLADGGTTPTYTTEDIAGEAIPQSGNYPIGCHVSLFVGDIRLPEATGSGKEYVVKNTTAGSKIVDAAFYDASGLVDGSAMRTLVGKESITVIDYKAHNWIIS